MSKLVDALFGCSHKRCTFPITAPKAAPASFGGAATTGTYIVCLDCGKEFPYDWQRMKVVNKANFAA